MAASMRQGIQTCLAEKEQPTGRGGGGRPSIGTGFTWLDKDRKILESLRQTFPGRLQILFENVPPQGTLGTAINSPAPSARTWGCTFPENLQAREPSGRRKDVETWSAAGCRIAGRWFSKPPRSITASHVQWLVSMRNFIRSASSERKTAMSRISLRRFCSAK